MILILNTSTRNSNVAKSHLKEVSSDPAGSPTNKVFLDYSLFHKTHIYYLLIAAVGPNSKYYFLVQ